MIQPAKFRIPGRLWKSGKGKPISFRQAHIILPFFVMTAAQEKDWWDAWNAATLDSGWPARSAFDVLSRTQRGRLYSSLDCFVERGGGLTRRGIQSRAALPPLHCSCSQVPPRDGSVVCPLLALHMPLFSKKVAECSVCWPHRAFTVVQGVLIAFEKIRVRLQKAKTGAPRKCALFPIVVQSRTPDHTALSHYGFSKFGGAKFFNIVSCSFVFFNVFESLTFYICLLVLFVFLLMCFLVCYSFCFGGDCSIFL